MLWPTGRLLVTYPSVKLRPRHHIVLGVVFVLEEERVLGVRRVLDPKQLTDQKIGHDDDGDPNVARIAFADL